MRIFSGTVLLIGAKLGHRAAEDAAAHDDKLLLYGLVVAVPLGIALLLGGLYELISNKRIGFFGRE